MADWTTQPIEDVCVGDMVVGFDQGGRGGRTRLVPTIVQATQSNKKPLVKSTLSSGKVLRHTPDHKWFTGRSLRGKDGHKPYAPLGFAKNNVKGLIRVVDLDQEPPEGSDVHLGRLSAFIDGEGSVGKGAIRISQCAVYNPEVTKRIHETITACGLDYGHSVTKTHKRGGTTNFWIRGGRQARYNVLKWCDPAKKRRLIESFYQEDGRLSQLGAGKSASGRDALVAQCELGIGDTYNIQTATGNYIAEGYASKNCQQLLNPIADAAQGFRREWLVHYKAVQPQTMNRYILVDPASGKKKSNDYTSLWVIGLGEDRNYYALDIVRDRLNLTERANLVIRKHQQWNPRMVGYEKYGMQADIEHIQSQMEIDNYRFPIQELKGPLGNLDRVRRLIPIFEQRRFWLPTSLHYTDYEKHMLDMVQVFIEEEFLPFPVGIHADMLDSCSRILDEDLSAQFPRNRKAAGANRSAIVTDTRFDPYAA